MISSLFGSHVPRILGEADFLGTPRHACCLEFQPPYLGFLFLSRLPLTLPCNTEKNNQVCVVRFGKLSAFWPAVSSDYYRQVEAEGAEREQEEEQEAARVAKAAKDIAGCAIIVRFINHWLHSLTPSPIRQPLALKCNALHPATPSFSFPVSQDGPEAISIVLLFIAADPEPSNVRELQRQRICFCCCSCCCCCCRCWMRSCGCRHFSPVMAQPDLESPGKLGMRERPEK